MAQDKVVHASEVQETRGSALALLGKLVALATSALAAVVLAIWLGLTLGQDIQNGMPWNQLQPRMVMAAVVLVPAVFLVVAHWRPTVLTERPVWWSGPVIAAGSVLWLLTCQSAFSSMGV